MDKNCKYFIFVLDEAMNKIPIPTRKELFEFLVEELKERNVGLQGDLDNFSKSLHRSFKKYIKGQEYKDKLFYEFIFITIDTLFDTSMPLHVTDNAVECRAATGRKHK